MLSRCYNPSAVNYRDYGAKGIRVCKRWQRFATFLLDMGRRPSPKHSVERRRNEQGYTPANCYWATPFQQAQNKTNNYKITLCGRTMTASAWARLVGISPRRVLVRLRLGWTAREAVLLPMSQRLRRPKTDKKTVVDAIALLRAGKKRALRERHTVHYTGRQILCVVCLRKQSGADALCVRCHQSLHDHSMRDATGYGYIRWAARRARRALLARRRR